MRELPILAFSSIPPGSPVTYRPGMPSAPPARVTSMIVLRTVAGASLGAVPVTARLEADAVDRASTSGSPDDLLDLLGQRGVLGEVDGLAAEALRLREALGDSCPRRSPPPRRAVGAECAAARPTGPAPAM